MEKESRKQGSCYKGFTLVDKKSSSLVRTTETVCDILHGYSDPKNGCGTLLFKVWIEV